MDKVEESARAEAGKRYFSVTQQEAFVSGALWHMAPYGVIATGHIRIRPETMEVWRDGVILKLTNTEQRLLKYMVRNPGHFMSREDMLREVWGVGYIGEHQYLRVWISRLRRWFGSPDYFEVSHSRGYRLVILPVVEPEEDDSQRAV